MEKEILTKERISDEIKNVYRWKQTIVATILFVVIAALFMLIGTLLYKAFRFDQLLYVLFLALVGGSLVTIIVSLVVSTYRRRRSADKNRYQVILDQLVHTEDDRDRLLDGNQIGLYRYLEFALFGKYEIPKRTHYAWSKLYAMSDEGLYNTAISGDTFYIVTVDGKHPLVVYNTKLFEYKE